MIFLHPLFMAVILIAIVMQARLGLEILAIPAKSPDMALRPEKLRRHRTLAWGLLIGMTLGACGGIFVTMKFLPGENGQPRQVFEQSAGHGYLGLAILGALMTMAALGANVKRVTKDKIRHRFLDFHRHMIWVVGGFGLFSLLTGIYVLWQGMRT